MLPRPPGPTLFPYTTLFRSTQFPAFAETQRDAIPGKWAWLDREMADGRRFIAGDDFSVADITAGRSEEHTSELQSRRELVCRLLLEKKHKKTTRPTPSAIAN